jgi:hypothetical protein
MSLQTVIYTAGDQATSRPRQYAGPHRARHPPDRGPCPTESENGFPGLTHHRCQRWRETNNFPPQWTGPSYLWTWDPTIYHRARRHLATFASKPDIPTKEIARGPERRS